MSSGLHAQINHKFLFDSQRVTGKGKVEAIHAYFSPLCFFFMSSFSLLLEKSHQHKVSLSEHNNILLHHTYFTLILQLLGTLNKHSHLWHPAASPPFLLSNSISGLTSASDSPWTAPLSPHPGAQSLTSQTPGPPAPPSLSVFHHTSQKRKTKKSTKGRRKRSGAW